MTVDAFRLLDPLVDNAKNGGSHPAGIAHFPSLKHLLFAKVTFCSGNEISDVAHLIEVLHSRQAEGYPAHSLWFKKCVNFGEADAKLVTDAFPLLHVKITK
ncbi:hypothetical protein DFP72DRAFT_1063452 [Ephemerocybe angulata]|uniref:Uncharacterized protein n=1 Tax=Ephemerocybe angulata TaxID=980116 RepID=A0A8H6I6B5_9AGAR|nr:hypothetical protein DFP72DRAFT_1063452 [Tulosesus angulatus]